MLRSAISSKENYVAAEFPPIMLFSSLRRARVIPFGSRQPREMRTGRVKRMMHEVAGGAEGVREGKLCVTAHNNAGDAEAVLSNDSQATAQWAAVYRAFIIPPSK